MIARVGTDDDDYLAIRTHAAAIDLSDRTILRITGTTRATYLQGILSNDTNLLTPGRGLYATILTPKGKMLADLTVSALAESFWVDAEPELSEKLLHLLNRYTIGRDATITSLAPAWGLMGLYGPRAGSVLGSAIPELRLPILPLGVTESSWHNATIVVAEAGYLGTPGFRMLLPAEAVDAMWTALQESGASPVGLDALETVRIEAGIPRYGSDMGEENFPPEARIEDRAISYTKGCYVGQETIARIKTYGHVNRLLVGLLPESDRPLAHGTKLYHPRISSILREEKEAGYVTSSIVSPALKRVIALGYVHHTIATPGTVVSVDAGEPFAATVVALPFATPGSEPR